MPRTADLANDTVEILAEASLGAHGSKSLRLERHGWFVVVHHHEGRDTIVVQAIHRDLADTYYAAFDGPRPWHDSYVRGTNDREPDKSVCVFAVGAGATPDEAARASLVAFLDSLNATLDPTSVEALDDGDNRDYQWGYRFRDQESGTAFKAAGRYVPGGAVLTWWT
jgi:hypothetical protein